MYILNTFLAGADPGAQGGKIQNPVVGSTLKDLLVNHSPTDFFSILLPKLIGLAFVAGVIIFTFIIILGAIQWIFSGGDKAALESARGKIMNAVVGLVILFSLFALLKVIEVFFGIDILALDIGPLKIQ